MHMCILMCMACALHVCRWGVVSQRGDFDTLVVQLEVPGDGMLMAC